MQLFSALSPQRGRIAAAAGLFGLLALGAALPGCVGVEGDVLSPRPLPDLSPPPDLAAPPLRCTVQKLSAPFCTDLTLWKQKVEAYCRMLGQPLITVFSPLGLCTVGMMIPSGALGVEFECCKPPTPPPPLMCKGRIQGDGTSCKDALTWQQSAAIDCGASGERVEALALDTPCMPPRYRYVRYQCCPPVPEGVSTPGAGPARSPSPSSSGVSETRY